METLNTDIVLQIIKYANIGIIPITKQWVQLSRYNISTKLAANEDVNQLIRWFVGDLKQLEWFLNHGIATWNKEPMIRFNYLLFALMLLRGQLTKLTYLLQKFQIRDYEKIRNLICLPSQGCQMVTINQRVRLIMYHSPYTPKFEYYYNNVWHMYHTISSPYPIINKLNSTDAASIVVYHFSSILISQGRSKLLLIIIKNCSFKINYYNLLDPAIKVNDIYLTRYVLKKWPGFIGKKLIKEAITGFMYKLLIKRINFPITRQFITTLLQKAILFNQISLIKYLKKYNKISYRNISHTTWKTLIHLMAERSMRPDVLNTLHYYKIINYKQILLCLQITIQECYNSTVITYLIDILPPQNCYIKFNIFLSIIPYLSYTNFITFSKKCSIINFQYKHLLLYSCKRQICFRKLHYLSKLFDI